MKTLVVYRSRTGFTEKYARIIAGKVGCEAISLRDVTPETAAGYDRIVFGSRLRAGSIDGLKKCRELFAKSGAKQLVLFATGATPNAATTVVDDMWKANLSQEELEQIPHFYMQGGLCYERMPVMEKWMMKLVAAMMAKKKDKTDIETGFAQAIAGSFDISSAEFADALVSYLSEEG